MARPAWDKKVNKIEFEYLILRCRSAFAEAFSRLSLTPHPWDENELAIIGKQIKLVTSLFHQYSNHPLPKIALKYEYEEDKLFVLWNWCEAFNRLKGIKVDTPSNSLNKYSITIFFTTEEFKNTKCKKFILDELKHQLSGTLPKMAYPRSNLSDRSEYTIDEKLWDLRVRMTDYIRRFLKIYQDQPDIDPFSVFFLKPSKKIQGEHISSGLFGYEYHLDKGQKKYLTEQIDDLPEINDHPERMKVLFPYGMCSRVFLSGKPQAPHTIEVLTNEYDKELDTTKAIEKAILSTGTMIEVPVYSPEVLSSIADGPNIIVSIRIPNNNKKRCLQENLDGEYEKKIYSYIQPDETDSFQLGESQIVTEVCQKLTNIFLFARETQLKDKIVSKSPIMKSLLEETRMHAKTDFHVLLLGESGVGKSTIAKDIHFHSNRASKNFTRISASTLTEDLGLSQLFGHVRGAFTGATGDKDGLLSKLDGGTLFLDDIDDLEPKIQTRLLSYLDTFNFYKLGDEANETPNTSNVRFICATNSPLKMIKRKETSIRLDFLWRISEVKYSVPGLEDRKGDIHDLILYFIKEQYKRAGLKFSREVDLKECYVNAATEKSWGNGQLRALSQVVGKSMTYAHYNKTSMDEVVFNKIYLEQDEGMVKNEMA